MVRHDREIVEAVLARLTIPNRFDHHAGDIGVTEVEWAGRGFGEEPVHDEKSVAARSRLRELTILWKAAVQPPCDEYGVPNVVKVRQPASMETGTKR